MKIRTIGWLVFLTVWWLASAVVCAVAFYFGLLMINFLIEYLKATNTLLAAAVLAAVIFTLWRKRKLMAGWQADTEGEKETDASRDKC